MTALPDGASELDSMTLRLVDAGIDVTSVEQIHLTSNVLTACDAWTATVVPDDPTTDALLKPGAKVQILINGLLQLTGTIDKRSKHGSRGGTTLTLSGRDMMGAIVDASVDPKFKVLETMTLGDVLAAVLAPLGITTIYNDGSLNQNAQTGAIEASAFTTSTTVVQVPTSTLAADGTVATSYATTSTTMKTGTKNPALATIKLKKLKPHIGEGTHQFCDRMLKRFGLRMVAAVDGSGVVIDRPDFDSAPIQTLIHSANDDGTNNVIDAHVTYDATSQPACIVALGRSNADAETPSAGLCVIAINELAGTDPDGNPLPAVRDILAKYPDAQILTMRGSVTTARGNFAPSLTARPIFVKDDESKTGLELVGFVRRKMSEFQHKALVATYEVDGLTQDGKPFASNTNVTVADEIMNLNQSLYVLEKDLSKSRHGGTMAKLQLILPHSLDFTTDS